MGKPLIASDVPGCKQVIDHEKNGLLCRVQDAEDLAEKMLQFIALSPMQRNDMGKESRAKAEREFDQKIVLDAYIKKIKSLIPT